MSLKLGPEPLAAPITRAHVGEHRSLFCRSYGACLDRAALGGWASWTCSQCARFHPPRPGPGGAQRSAVKADVSRATPRPSAAPRARRAEPSQPPERMPAHSLERESGVLHVRLDAPSVPALFIEAGRAVAEVIGGRPLEPPVEWAEEVSIAAPDLDQLLVAWIRELALRSERTRARFTEFDIVYLSDSRLVASIRGLRLGRMRNPLKAAAYRAPSLVRRLDHVSAVPLLDV